MEINNNGQKWVGQIREITWRSTVLTGILDELITIANRTVGQSEIVTWGAGGYSFLARTFVPDSVWSAHRRSAQDLV